MKFDGGDGPVILTRVSANHSIIVVDTQEFALLNDITEGSLVRGKIGTECSAQIGAKTANLSEFIEHSGELWAQVEVDGEFLTVRATDLSLAQPGDEPIHQIPSEFASVPADSDTRMIEERYVHALHALWQRWSWDGMVGCSVIFPKGDVADIDDDALRGRIVESGLVDPEQSLNVSRKDDDFVFVNFVKGR